MCYQLSLAFDKMALSDHYKIPFPEELSWEPVFFETGFHYPQWPVIQNYAMPHFSLMRWGLIPHWAGSMEKAMELRRYTLNAVSETAAEKPAFRKGMKSFPVVIPLGGFFENRHEGKMKIPYFVSGKHDKLISLAGIADEWVNMESGEVISTFSILTCRAEGIMAFVHNSKLRSPLVLEPERWRDWLDTGREAEARLGLGAHPDKVLLAWRIRPDFNKAKTNKNQALYIEPWVEKESERGLF